MRSPPIRRLRVGPPVGPTHIVEEVTLSADGDQYTGPFRLDALPRENIATSFTGVITTTRITVNTKVSDLL